MLAKLFTKILGNRNERVLSQMAKVIKVINKIEPTIKKLNDKQLSSKTFYFQERISKGFHIDSLLPEAFAVVREASRRIFGMRHFDVQLIGGMVLNNRCIAEMRTGEGKTLTATLPAYLNALSKKGVHIVTVNDYLAQRDAENNRSLFEFLNMSVGINLPGLSVLDKKKAYNADITYGTNNEYGFDYLRDNMIFSAHDKVQRKLYYALLDEVDSILIDEARTPLIISGPTEDNLNIYLHINKLIPYLICQDKEDSENFKGKGHFSIDRKSRQVYLTERGLIYIEELLIQNGFINKSESLYSSVNIILMHYIIAALRAHVLYFRNIDYIIKNGQVIIVDEHTGRTMPGRRWSDGLHQAIEAKENLSIQNENQTLASITFQNYFRLYEKLAGMTGTAYTEAFEFNSIYKLDTIVVPTNKPMIRKDLPDLVYMTEKEKISAIIKDIKTCVKREQPVLVGTISIKKSELISSELIKANIPHKVLNAKFHAMEADIIAQAGKPGAVTIATNMAGRGTDIILGGNWKEEILALKSPLKQQIITIKDNWQARNKKVKMSGGLHIIGTERHESRRIDNQLRGRSGRQGDNGSSRFYLSMEDSLMRIFASERIYGMMRKLGMNFCEAIEHPWVTKAIVNAQRKVESRNFEIRKQLLEYDDVANDQRCIIYAQRNELLNTSDISRYIYDIREDILENILNMYIPSPSLSDNCDILGLEKCLKDDFDIYVPVTRWLDNSLSKNKEIIRIQMLIQYQYKEKIVGSSMMRTFEKNIMLQTLDSLWKEHLAAMDYLRQGIHLRGYAQKDPKQEYKRESFIMFTDMLFSLKYKVISDISKLKISFSKEKDISKKQHIYTNNEYLITQKNDMYHKEKSILKKSYIGNLLSPLLHSHVRRNDFCLCGSGKKFKYCHGKLR